MYHTPPQIFTFFMYRHRKRPIRCSDSVATFTSVFCLAMENRAFGGHSFRRRLECRHRDSRLDIAILVANKQFYCADITNLGLILYSILGHKTVVRTSYQSDMYRLDQVCINQSIDMLPHPYHRRYQMPIRPNQ